MKKNRAQKLMLAAGAVGAGSMLISGLVSASTLTSHKTKVVADTAYFAGKTITFIDGSSPGSGGDTYVRNIAPLVGAYLHCVVHVVNLTGTGSILAQDTVANSTPNGLTIGELTIATNLIAGTLNVQGPTFSMQKVPIIAGIQGTTGSPLVAAPGNPLRNFHEFVSSRAIKKVMGIAGSASNLELDAVLDAYGTPYQFVSGYSTTALVANGFLRGDEPFAVTGATSLLPFIQQGTAQPLALFAGSPWPKTLPGYAQLKNVPDVTQYAAKYPPKTKKGKTYIAEVIRLFDAPTYGYFAPPGTPRNLVLALTDAVRSALAQPGVKAEFVTQGTIAPFVGPATVLAEIRSAASHVSAFAGLNS